MSESRRRRSLLGVLLLIALAAPIAVWVSVQPAQSAFTDVEEVGENRLGAGRLDLEVGESSILLSADNIAPGDVIDGRLELKNAGDLSLEYSIVATVEGSDLAPWLTWWLTDPVGVDCASGRAITPPTVIADGTSMNLLGSARGPRLVAAGALDPLCLVAELRLDAPNSVQGRSVGVELDITAQHVPELDGPAQ